MHNSINSFLIYTRRILIIIKSTMPKESEDYNIQILKVMKSETPTTQGLPLLFYIKLKEGSEPIFLKYSILKEKYPMTLISFFESRSNIKEKAADPDHISQTSANQDSDQEVDFSDDEESEQEHQADETHNKPIANIKASMPSKKVKVDQPTKSKKAVKQTKKKVKFPNDQSDQEDEIVGEEECRSVSPQRVKINTKKEAPGPKSQQLLDYDKIIKDLDMVDSVSPAILSSRLIEKIPPRNYIIERKESHEKSKKHRIQSYSSKIKPQKSPNKQPIAKKSNRK